MKKPVYEGVTRTLTVMARLQPVSFYQRLRAIGHPRPEGESGKPDSAAHGDKRQAPGRSRQIRLLSDRRHRFGDR
jgi:hypothetical protein